VRRAGCLTETAGSTVEEIRDYCLTESDTVFIPCQILLNLAGHVARMEKERDVYRVLVRNILMESDRGEVVIREWIDLAHDRHT
jgi:hypothetical protein